MTGIEAGGGWCAPTEFDAGVFLPSIYEVSFPTVLVPRGGLTFDRLTPEEIRLQDARVAFITRIADRLEKQRADAVDAACVTALANGWDVHVYEPPTVTNLRRASDQDLIYLRCVGIEFTPAAHPVPTIHLHPCSHDWQWDDEYDD